MGIKENWEKVDECCPQCGQVTKQAKGITRQNIKRLFSIKFNYTEFLITFMLIMILVLAWAYMKETKESRDWINSMYSGDKDACILTCNMKCEAKYEADKFRNDSFPENWWVNKTKDG